MDSGVFSQEGAHVQNRAVHLGIGVNLEGTKEVLGMWTTGAEGAKYWLQVLTDLQNRALRMCSSPASTVWRLSRCDRDGVSERASQLCIVHLVRGKPKLRIVETPLRRICGRSAPRPDLAAHWERVIPFFAVPADIRRVIYTTSAVEPLNMMRKLIKTRGSFPNEDAALKLPYTPSGLRSRTARCRTITGQLDDALRPSASSVGIRSGHMRWNPFSASRQP